METDFNRNLFWQKKFLIKKLILNITKKINFNKSNNNNNKFFKIYIKTKI